MNNSHFQSGANIDERPQSEKDKDYKFEEIVAAANPVNWVEKQQSDWKKFPIFNQDGSGSCVAQTMAKLLGILYWAKNQIYVHFSATHIYQRRANKPGGGMAGMDVFNIAREGATLEELVPSQRMNDEQMDSVEIPQYKKDVGAVFKINNYVELPTKDIEIIASVIQTTGKAVMVWFYFNFDEWTEQPIVKNASLGARDAQGRHSITAVDFTLHNGKKALIIEDSWGPNAGIGGQRIIDEDFFKARNFFAAYPIDFKFADQTQPQPEPQPAPVNPKPKHIFSQDLKFGQRNNDIIALQDILKYEGLFPTNAQSTGYFGAITAKAVLALQRKYQVAPEIELTQLQGRVVGPKTKEKLNEIYN